MKSLWLVVFEIPRRPVFRYKSFLCLRALSCDLKFCPAATELLPAPTMHLSPPAFLHQNSCIEISIDLSAYSRSLARSLALVHLSRSLSHWCVYTRMYVCIQNTVDEKLTKSNVSNVIFKVYTAFSKQNMASAVATATGEGERVWLRDREGERVKK